MCACRRAHRQVDAAMKINHLCMQRQPTDRQTEMRSDMNSICRFYHVCMQERTHS